MNLIVTLVIIGILAIIVMIATSIVINIANQIIGNLDDTKYKDKKQGQCEGNIKIINDALIPLNIARVVAIILLVISILILVFVIIGIIVLLRGGGASIRDKGVTSGIFRNLLSNKYVYLVITFIFFLVFLYFTITYGVVLSGINSVNKECFSGDLTDENSEIKKLDSARSISITQMVLCLILSLIFLGVFIFIIFAFKAPKNNKILPENFSQKFNEMKDDLGNTNAMRKLSELGNNIKNKFAWKEKEVDLT